MKNRKFMGLIALGMTMGMSLSLVAQPVIEQITAQKKSDIVYKVDGQQIMHGESAIVFEDRVYVPLRAVAEGLDYEVDYTNNVVDLSSNAAENKEQDTVDEVVDHMNVLGSVVEVTDKQITVLPAYAEDVPGQHIVLNVGDETAVIMQDGSEGKISDIKVGDLVDATHKPMMTNSLPPQTPAVQVKVVTGIISIDPMAEQKPIMEGAKVTEVFEDGFTVEHRGQEIILKTDETTFFHHERNRRVYTLQDVEVGLELTIHHSDAMTLSLPPQTFAHEVVFFN